MALHTRKLTPADQPQWRALRLEALERYPLSFLTTFEDQSRRSAQDDRAGLTSGNWYGFFDDRDMVAQAAMFRPSPSTTTAHRCVLGAFYVMQTHHGTETAQAFLGDLIGMARKAGRLQIELVVAENNARAIRFYERNGFERTGREPRAVIVDGVAHDDFCYVLMLDR